MHSRRRRASPSGQQHLSPRSPRADYVRHPVQGDTSEATGTAISQLPQGTATQHLAPNPHSVAPTTRCPRPAAPPTPSTPTTATTTPPPPQRHANPTAATRPTPTTTPQTPRTATPTTPSPTPAAPPTPAIAPAEAAKEQPDTSTTQTPPCLPEFCQNGVEVPALNADRVPGVSDAEWRRDIENLRRIVEIYANDTSCLAGDTAQRWWNRAWTSMKGPLSEATGAVVCGGAGWAVGTAITTSSLVAAPVTAGGSLFVNVVTVGAVAGTVSLCNSVVRDDASADGTISSFGFTATLNPSESNLTATTTTTVPTTTTTEAVVGLPVPTCVRLRDGHAEFAWALPTGAAEPAQWSMNLDMGGLPLRLGTWPGSKRTHSLNLGTSLIEHYAGRTWTFSIDASPQSSPPLSGSPTGTVGNDWAGDTGVGQC